MEKQVWINFVRAVCVTLIRVSELINTASLLSILHDRLTYDRNPEHRASKQGAEKHVPPNVSFVIWSHLMGIVDKWL
jgi:hypothetical protein